MAYSLSNKCAKNLCKHTVLVQLIVKTCSHVFWSTVYIVVLVLVAMEKISNTRSVKIFVTASCTSYGEGFL